MPKASWLVWNRKHLKDWLFLGRTWQWSSDGVNHPIMCYPQMDFHNGFTQALPGCDIWFDGRLWRGLEPSSSRLAGHWATSVPLSSTRDHMTDVFCQLAFQGPLSLCARWGRAQTAAWVPLLWWHKERNSGVLKLLMHSFKCGTCVFYLCFMMIF